MILEVAILNVKASINPSNANNAPLIDPSSLVIYSGFFLIFLFTKSIEDASPLLFV